MFEFVYEWLKNLTTYTILVAIVMQLIPNEEYRKYVRFFCGMVLIVMLVTPLLQLGGIKEAFEELYQGKEYERVVKELEEAERIAIEVKGEASDGLEELDEKDFDSR